MQIYVIQSFHSSGVWRCSFVRWCFIFRAAAPSILCMANAEGKPGSTGDSVDVSSSRAQVFAVLTAKHMAETANVNAHLLEQVTGDHGKDFLDDALRAFVAGTILPVTGGLSIVLWNKLASKGELDDDWQGEPVEYVRPEVENG